MTNPNFITMFLVYGGFSLHRQLLRVQTYHDTMAYQEDLCSKRLLFDLMAPASAIYIHN